ncbi:uncharacterized protein BJ212DRAFT_1375862 [Suillus subaureus]|uniref:Uncharacterized protein n=1 Tax=Suillus subaureus TaxID=48587 RepID=A0A9P7E573_9AGAM|nr:uncharacterized protein BJ212DRAFT_1375862 [Suillus subaureus]KAG1811254.1 hypothetical protein BJ212DRAFT_1375862 [Suillus subaureus]
MILNSVTPSPLTHMPCQKSYTQKFVSTTRTTTTITTTPTSTSITTTTKTTQARSANYGKNGNQKLIGAGTTGGCWSECPKGAVPSGAVIGGQRNGLTLYIIRVSYAGGCYPSGAFSQNETGVVFGYGGRTITGNNFQCLTGSGTSFRWITVSGPCTSDKVGTNTAVVQGGWEADGTALLIAQVSMTSGLNCGRVKWNDYAYIATTSGEQKFETYAVLAFA